MPSELRAVAGCPIVIEIRLKGLLSTQMTGGHKKAPDWSPARVRRVVRELLEDDLIAFLQAAENLGASPVRDSDLNGNFLLPVFAVRIGYLD